MYIIIAGIGKVGSYLTQELSLEGHDIKIVDIKADRVTPTATRHDIIGYTGNIIDPNILEEVEVSRADLFIAVTANDELNLLSCLLARKAGCSQTIARVRNPEYSDAMNYLQSQLGLAMIINPEYLAAREIFRVLSLPAVTDVDEFSHGKSEILKFKILSDSILCDMCVRDIPGRIHKDVLVCVVERDGKAFIPDGNFVLKAKDRISIAGNSEATAEFIRRTGMKGHRIQNVMIIGAGKLSYYLAKMLSKSKISMTIIDNKLSACEYFATMFPHANVIQGDGSDQNLLIEEGLDDMDAFVALTGLDEENVFLSLYAGNRADLKTVTKVNRIFFDEVFQTLDLDTIINPKKLTAEYIVRYVRALANSVGSNVETIHKLAGDQVEAVEFKIRPDSPVIGIPLQDLNLKPGILVTLIVRNGQMILPRGNHRMLAGDSVVIVTNHTGFCDIKEIFQKSR